MPDHYVPACTLSDLGYSFNEKGELRTLDEGLPFKFTTQQAYERLGEAMTHEVYSLMEKIGLQRVVLKRPQDEKTDDHYSFVFVSPEYEQKHIILVLVHGSGVVRSGQWSRKLILNENLDKGSMLPYIERAMSNDWGVVVANANLNEQYLAESEVSEHLQYSKSHEMHMENLWYRFIRYTRAQEIFVVAHSRGGHDVSHVMEAIESEHRVSCVCLTDSWFEFSESRTQQPIVINWAARDKSALRRPSSKKRRPNELKIHQIWAGTSEHERSSCCAFESIFHVLENGPHEDNLDRLLLDAWELMDPPQLEPEIPPFPKPKMISTDADGNLKVNEELFNVEGVLRPEGDDEDKAPSDSHIDPIGEDEEIQLESENGLLQQSEAEPIPKLPRLKE